MKCFLEVSFVFLVVVVVVVVVVESLLNPPRVFGSRF